MRPIVACVAVLALLGGCTPPPGSTFEPSASPGAVATDGPTGGLPSEPPPSASDAATFTPTAAPTPPPSPDLASRPNLRPDKLATVTVGGLAVRVDASVAAPLQMGFEASALDAGDHVLVLGDPTWADATWWVMVGTDDGCYWGDCAEQEAAGVGQVVVGWVDGGTKTVPSLEADRSWCPGAGPTLRTLINLSRIERLGCYGSTSLTFSAYRTKMPPEGGLGGACETQKGYPRWLTCDNINYSWVNRDGGFDWEFLLHFDPATGIEPTGLVEEGPSERLRITGHFDDPAARKCEAVHPTAEGDDPEWSELHCRTLFVVEAIN